MKLSTIFAFFLSIAVIVLIGILNFPAFYVVTEAGEYIVKDGLSLSLCDGTALQMLGDFLGGQTYFCCDMDPQQLRQVEKENEEKIKETLVCSTGDVYQEERTSTDDAEKEEATETVATAKQNQYVKQLKQNLDVNFLWEKFYIIDSTTSVTKNLFPVKELLEENLSLPVKKGKKQILIYHTHGASEKFADSSKKEEDSIVGVGSVLAQELEKKGYGVYHDRTKYDWIEGSLNRSLAYNEALKGIEKIRAQYKDIHVMIDLHRDSIGKGRHTYTTIGGKKTAIVMFFNGMSRTKNGPIEYLQNNNLQGNLAFSLQLKCKAMECYDGFTKPIYLKGYRYNLHLEKRSLLIELGNENNTVEEAKNAAKPLADIIYRVLANVT